MSDQHQHHPMHPDSMPFDVAMASNKLEESFKFSAVETSQAIDFAKRMLLQNRVKDFAAADVVAVARLILEGVTRT